MSTFYHGAMFRQADQASWDWAAAHDRDDRDLLARPTPIKGSGRAPTRTAPVPPRLATHPAMQQQSWITGPDTAQLARQRAAGIAAAQTSPLVRRQAALARHRTKIAGLARDAQPVFSLAPVPPTASRTAITSAIRQLGITGWLNVADELKLKSAVQAAGCRYAKLRWKSDGAGRPVADFMTAFDFACQTIDQTPPGKVARILITCTHGAHRSPTVAAFLLAAFAGQTLDGAWEIIRRQYPASEHSPALYQSAASALAVLRGRAPVAAASAAQAAPPAQANPGTAR